jgi:hypothetical protein
VTLVSARLSPPPVNTPNAASRYRRRTERGECLELVSVWRGGGVPHALSSTCGEGLKRPRLLLLSDDENALRSLDHEQATIEELVLAEVTPRLGCAAGGRPYAHP